MNKEVGQRLFEAEGIEWAPDCAGACRASLLSWEPCDGKNECLRCRDSVYLLRVGSTSLPRFDAAVALRCDGRSGRQLPRTRPLFAELGFLNDVVERQVSRWSGPSPERELSGRFRPPPTFARQLRTAATSLLSSFVHLSASNLQRVRVPGTVRQTAGRSWRWGDPTARGLHLKWRR